MSSDLQDDGPTSRWKTRHDERAGTDLRSMFFLCRHLLLRHLLHLLSGGNISFAVRQSPFVRQSGLLIGNVYLLARSLRFLPTNACFLFPLLRRLFSHPLSLLISRVSRAGAREQAGLWKKICATKLSVRSPLRAVVDRSYVLPAGRTTIELDDGFVTGLSFSHLKVVFTLAVDVWRTIRLLFGRVIEETTRTFKTSPRYSTNLLDVARQRTSPLPSSTPPPLPPTLLPRPSSLLFLLLPGTISFALRVCRSTVREADLASWIIRMHQIVHDRKDRACGVDTQGDPPE